MKIAITSQGPDLNSPIDSHFGRAPYFCIIHVEDRTLTPIDNASGANAAQGAGIQAAQTLVDHGVQALITGSVGPKAWPILEAANIRMLTVNGGTVEQALNAFRAKELLPIAR
jgi:predicted Fe-Mo cluster-binding NifX family protein